MSDFEPGDGWVNVQFTDRVPTGTVAFREDDGSWSYWVRETPVPPLPTAPYTVIRVTWRDPNALTGSHIYTLSSDRYWVPQNRHAETLRPESVRNLITSFEVLSEPRAVTAKAILNGIYEQVEDGALVALALRKIADEFGVTDE